MDTQPLSDAIHSNFPDLPVASIELAGEGMDSIAVLVNREWIFRFPKHDGVSAGIELEARLLPELQRSIDVRIPVPVFVGTDPRTGRRFSGYRRVEGATLNAHVFPGLDARLQDPDYELQWLYADFGERFLQTYLAVNPHPCPDRLRRKLRFFDRASTLDDALIGFRRNEPDVVEIALAQLREQASG